MVACEKTSSCGESHVSMRMHESREGQISPANKMTTVCEPGRREVQVERERDRELCSEKVW